MNTMKPRTTKEVFQHRILNSVPWFRVRHYHLTLRLLTCTTTEQHREVCMGRLDLLDDLFIGRPAAFATVQKADREELFTLLMATAIINYRELIMSLTEKMTVDELRAFAV